MGKTYHVDPGLFRKKYLPLMWIGMIPSFALDAVLICRTVVQLISNSGNSVVSLLIDLVMMMIMNAALLKSVPLIIYFVHRKNLKESVVILSNEALIYQQRLLVQYEFDFNYTFFHEHYLAKIDSFRKGTNSSLVIHGEHEVRCLLEDGAPQTDLYKGELKPRVLRRKRCVLPAVFEGMDEITAKLNELAVVEAAAK